MAMRNFLKLPKHQQYHYRPRYWDPEKEEIRERLKQIDELKEQGADGMKARISSGFKRGYLADNRLRKRQMMRSNMLLLAIVVFLLMVAYIFLNVYLPRIVNAIETVN